ncbi:hypothetical protein SETIT_8G233700v2 [Setaria italica]|uniref:Uncharacterized protein n=1 Tax=Setaria italica TaxID=4555 RepID=A0A368SB06_SETIT|nr:hypothetical protein SETIT_8G233700v2 [Setaria italica]
MVFLECKRSCLQELHRRVTTVTRDLPPYRSAVGTRPRDGPTTALLVEFDHRPSPFRCPLLAVARSACTRRSPAASTHRRRRCRMPSWPQACCCLCFAELRQCHAWPAFQKETTGYEVQAR